MINILKEYLNKNKFISIYFYPNTNSNFSYGRILAVNETHVAFYSLTPQGEPDGIIAKEIDDIIRVEINPAYNERMKKLMKNETIKLSDYNISSSNIPQSLLLIAKTRGEIVAVELKDSGYYDVTGFVDSIDDGICCIKQLDSYGYEDGVSFFRIEDISKIECNSTEEQTIHKLWKNNY